MSLFLVFIAIAVAGAAVVLSLGRLSPGRSADDDGADEYGLVEPVASLPPVLLPIPVESADVKSLRFSSALRGYRMDQVDEVLGLLASELERRDRHIAELETGADRREPETDNPPHGC